MTNSQQTIKLDLSSLLTETSAHSDNKYTSSALELLLNGDVDQSGAGLFSTLAAAANKGARAAGQTVKRNIVEAGKDSLTTMGQSVAAKARELSPTRGNITQAFSKVAAKARELSPTRGDITHAFSNVADKARAGSERIQQATQGMVDKLSPRSRPTQQSASNTDQSVVANGNREETGALSDTSSAPVNRDENALFLIQNRLTNIENGIKEILRLLQSNQ